MTRVSSIFCPALTAAAIAIPVVAAAATPTFTKDVAPVLYRNCVVCHRPGEVAPMSLTSYAEVRPWARAIKNKVVAREMPPWHASVGSMKMANDRSLSQTEIETIVAWADGGAPKGDDKDLPPMPTFNGGWMYGEPDAIIELPVQVSVPAEGEIPPELYFVQSPFPDDVWIQAMQIRTSNTAIVHHATLFIRALPEGFVVRDGKPVAPEGQSQRNFTTAEGQAGEQALGPASRLVSYVPGRGWERYPEGTGRRLPKGAYIEFNMHYQASGKPETERAQFGIWFAKTPVRREMINVANMGDRGTTMVENKPLGTERVPNIPAFAENWKIANFKLFPEPATLYALSPHMHLRGKDMKFILTYPDGREEVVLDVQRYDFNWQLYYELEKPLSIPAGSKLTAIAHYDNSPRNRWNPAPEKEVYWSEQSWDEMYNPQIRYTWDRQDLTKPGGTTTQPTQSR